MLTNIEIIGLMLLLHATIVAYIWPYKIAKDPERPLTWYYPCVCGCFRKRVKRNPDDNEVDHEEPLLIQS